MEYYSLINQAKKAVIDNQPERASNLYFKAFEEFDFEFARDCFNAIEISLFVGDNERTQYFVKKAIRRGVPIKFLTDHAPLQPFIQTNYWVEVLTVSEELITLYKQGIDHELRTEVIAMFSDDQKIRKKRYKTINFPFRPFIDRKWKKLNAQQVNRIIEITEKKGFPGERLIGIGLNWMHEKVGNSQLSAGMPIVLMIHHYSQPNSFPKNLLLKEIEKGNIHNEHFATIADFQVEYGKGKFESFGFTGSNFLK